jgi:uncharacterized membrane protein (DUF106 family)
VAQRQPAIVAEVGEIPWVTRYAVGLSVAIIGSLILQIVTYFRSDQSRLEASFERFKETQERQLREIKDATEKQIADLRQSSARDIEALRGQQTSLVKDVAELSASLRLLPQSLYYERYRNEPGMPAQGKR